jgi:nicotinamide-nucleotide adenylyltransferase
MQSALFIGRFQPFHNGHLSAIKDILEENERIIIVIGSAEKNFLPQNPFTAGERFQLIEESLKEAKIPNEKFCIIPIRNVNNYALWVNHLNIYTPSYTRLYTGSEIVKACYNGKYFKPNEPSKTGPEIINLDRKFELSASKIRESILNNQHWEDMLPPATVKLLKKWDAPSRIKAIQETMDLTKYNNSY